MPFEFLPLDPERSRRLGLPEDRGVPIRVTRSGEVRGAFNLERIVRDIESYRAENPEDTDYDQFLGNWYHHQAVTLANAGSVARAYPILLKAIEVCPGDPQMLADLARAAFDLGRYDEARLRYEALIEQPTATQDLFDGLARCLSCLGDHESAVVVAERGVARFPDDWAAMNTLTTVLYHAGDVHGLDKALFQQLSKDPNDPLTLEKLGVIFRQTGRFPEAKVVLDRARRIAPDNVRLVYQSGMLDFQIGDHDGSAREFEEALSRDARHVDTLVAYGLLEYARNRVDHGRELLERAEAAAPKDYRGPLHLGLMAVRTKDHARGKECLARALAHRPDDRASVRRILYVARDEGWNDIATEAEAQLGTLPGGDDDADV